MRRRPQRVLIAGGGVAGLETLLALRALAADRVDITVLTPEAKFVNRSMAVDQPADLSGVKGLKLRDVTADLGAHWERGRVRGVDPARHVAITERGRELAYDQLVLALGARPERVWRHGDVLTYHDAGDAHEYRRLLRQLEEGRVRSVAFVKPCGASWLLPLYELALSAAEFCEARGLSADLRLVTPEHRPLEAFGPGASEEIEATLEAFGVALHTGSRGVPSRPGRLFVSPSRLRLEVDRVVTLPRLVGPALPGLPRGRDGFIATDAYGRVAGVADVHAAGDATAFAIKQGGLAAQQADVVARSLAAAAGAHVTPRPFRPVLRGLLTAGGTARYMRARPDGDCAFSREPLWWPPNRLCGRYLAPYLSRSGRAAVRFQRPLPGEGPQAVMELADL
jgi:sulfide:quinone oxidoreductase